MSSAPPTITSIRRLHTRIEHLIYAGACLLLRSFSTFTRCEKKSLDRPHRFAGVSRKIGVTLGALVSRFRGTVRD